MDTHEGEEKLEKSWKKSWTPINFSSGKNGCPFLLFFTPLGKIGVLFYSFFYSLLFYSLGKSGCPFLPFFYPLGKSGCLFLPLMGIGFLDHSSHEKNMAKLRRLYGRIRPDSVELSILRGILSETQRCLGASKNES